MSEWFSTFCSIFSNKIKTDKTKVIHIFDGINVSIREFGDTNIFQRFENEDTSFRSVFQSIAFLDP